MTRINLVPVDTLADQHLFAEWREIKMVPAALRRSLRTRAVKSILNGIPERYTLNKGHVTFFFNKMKFLTERYELLTAELLKRDYNIVSNHFSFFTFDIPGEFKVVEWLPSNSEINVNIARIVLRLNERPTWYRHYGKVTNPSFFEEIYS